MDPLKEFTELWKSGTEAFRVHTSGSTGAPKEIVLSRSDMIHSARATNSRFGITSSSTLTCPLSLDYIAGKMMVVRAYVAGATFQPIEVSNRFALPDGYHDLLCIVPTMIPNLLEHPEWSVRIGDVIVGGAAPAPSALKALEAAGYRFWVSYGMTETCSHVALAGRDGIYEAMPGVSFSTDARGCLVIEAPGYSWEVITTNDAVELVDKKSFRWKGRIDGVINSGGIKLFPEELERLYEPYLKEKSFAVSSRKSDQWGEEVVLVTTEDAEKAQTSLRSSDIEHRRLPKVIISVEALPTTRTGKPDRAAISRLANG